MSIIPQAVLTLFKPRADEAEVGKLRIISDIELTAKTEEKSSAPFVLASLFIIVGGLCTCAYWLVFGYETVSIEGMYTLTDMVCCIA